MSWPAAFEHLRQRDGPRRALDRHWWNLGHRQAPPGRSDRVALPGVRLLPGKDRVPGLAPLRPADDARHGDFGHGVAPLRQTSTTCRCHFRTPGPETHRHAGFRSCAHHPFSIPQLTASSLILVRGMGAGLIRAYATRDGRAETAHIPQPGRQSRNVVAGGPAGAARAAALRCRLVGDGARSRTQIRAICTPTVTATSALGRADAAAVATAGAVRLRHARPGHSAGRARSSIRCCAASAAGT
jgi:hypothetical protein